MEIAYLNQYERTGFEKAHHRFPRRRSKSNRVGISPFRDQGLIFGDLVLGNAETDQRRAKERTYEISRPMIHSICYLETKRLRRLMRMSRFPFHFTGRMRSDSRGQNVTHRELVVLIDEIFARMIHQQGEVRPTTALLFYRRNVPQAFLIDSRHVRVLSTSLRTCIRLSSKSDTSIIS